MDSNQPTDRATPASGPPWASPAGWWTPRQFGVLLALALVAAFPTVVVGTHSFFYRDYGVLAYPVAFFHQESFWRGELPQWNPYSHCGVPFLAQWGTNWYPLSLLYLVFPLPWSLSYFCLAHLVLAGLGMYRLAQRWVDHRFAASVAGLAYVFNGATLSCLIWPNYTVALGWMPWVVLCAERSWREGGRWIAVAALVAALQLLSGVPELVLFTWLVVGVLWLQEWISARGTRGQRVGRLAAVIGLAAGMAAVQLLPFFDLLAHSQRDRGFAPEKWAMPIWGWANLLVPLFHCFRTHQGPWFQYGQEFVNSYYLGVGVLVCAAWALWRVRAPRVWLLAALTGFGLVMALGERGLVFGWIKQLIPFLGIARYPIKFVLLAVFAVPLLAAWAIRELDRADILPAHRARGLIPVGVGAVGGIVGILWFAKNHPFAYDQWPATWQNGLGRVIYLGLILGALAGWSRLVHGRARFAVGVVVLVAVVGDALTHLPQQIPTLPVSVFTPGVWQQGTGLLPPRPGEGRVLITPDAEQRLLRSEVPGHEADFLGKRLAAWSNLNLLDRVPKVNGAATLQVREQKQVEGLIYGPTNRASAGLLDFLAVSQTSAPENPAAWMPRSNACAIVTGGQRPVFADPADTLRALGSAEFDPRRVVYLPNESRSLVTVSNQTECAIQTTHFSAGRVTISVAARETSLVVISQTFYPLWRAYLDGRRVPLLRANHAFQAVEVPAGRHEVTLVYQDTNLALGAGISGLAVLLCAAVWWRGRRTTGPTPNP